MSVTMEFFPLLRGSVVRTYDNGQLVCLSVCCFDCKKNIEVTTEERGDYPLANVKDEWNEPSDDEGNWGDVYYCVDCAKKRDPWCTANYCYCCGSQFFGIEACSRECGYWIDDQVERASQREYDYIERRLESL